jgi:transposase
MKIVALDVGKFKSVFIVRVAGGKVADRYGKIATTAGAIHDLLVEEQPDRLVLEIGPCAGWICDLAAVLEIERQVANVGDERWRWVNIKKKTDRADALKMAELSEMNRLPLVAMPAGEIRAWRSLIQYRAGLVARRTAIKNTIRSIYLCQGLQMSRSSATWSKAGLVDLNKDARPLSECDRLNLWRGQLHEELQQLASMEKNIEAVEAKLDEIAAADKRVALVRTAPFVGPRLGELVVAVLDDAKRFKNRKQVGAYAGLTPRVWQSGESMRQGHISLMGDPLLRAILTEVCWLGIRRDGWIKNTYENVLRGNEKRKKVAIIAVARRLLIRLWAMLRDNTQWIEPLPQREAAMA